MWGSTFATQGAMILPHPGDTNIYYIITAAPEPQWGLRYHIVDKRGDNGLGEMISRNNLLRNSNPCGKVTAIRHSDNSSIWVISHSKYADTFYSFLITKSGINPNPVMSLVGHQYNAASTTNPSNIGGMLKISPDNTKLVATSENWGFEIFDFDNKTGIISNPISINDKVSYLGAEFSPNGNFLYLTTSSGGGYKDSLFQFDVSVYDRQIIVGSKFFLATARTTGYNDFFSALQLGINGKIYGTFGEYLTIINNPNEKGSFCNFVLKGLQSFTNVGYGLPDFLQSYFFKPDFQAESLCWGDTTFFSITNTSKIDSVFWCFGDTTASSNNYSKLLSPKHIFSDTGLYNVSVVYWHEGGEADTFKRDILISPYPSAAFTVNEVHQCFKENNFVFRDTTHILSGGFSWEWNFGDNSKSYAQHPSKKYTKADSFEVSLTVLSDYGCESKASKKVYVYPSPQALFTLNDSIQCENDQYFLFTDTSTITGDSIAKNIWIQGTDTIRNQQSAIRNNLKHGKWNLELIITTTNGCQDTAVRQITVHPSPTALFTINDSVQCENEQLFEFANNSSVTGDSISDLLWIIGTDTIRNQQSAIRNKQKPGTWNLELIVTTTNLCSDTALHQITVFPSPKADFIINDSVQCENQQLFKFTNTSTVAGDSISNLLWILGADTIRNQQSAIRNNLKPGTCNLELIVTTTNLCSDTALRQITVFPSPKAGFSINDSVQCENVQLFEFTNTSTVKGDSISDLLWITGTDSIRNQQSPIRNDLEPGTWNMELIVTTTNLCSDTALRQITVHPSPKADFSINDTAQCENEQLFEFTNTSTVAGDSISDLLWIIGTDSIRNQQSAIRNNMEPGARSQKLIVTTTNLCSDTTLKQIIVFPAPRASFSLNDSAQCLKGNRFEFTNTSTILAGTMNHQWIFGDNADTITSTNPVNTYDTWQKYEVQLIVSSDHNCTDTFRKSTYVFPMPLAAFIYLNNCLEDTMYFYDKSSIDSGNIAQWLWDFKNGNQSTLQNPWQIYSDSGQKAVTLVSTSDFGCSSDTTRYFFIEAHVTEPVLERATIENNETVLVEWLPPRLGNPMTYHLERSIDGANWQHIKDENRNTFSYLDPQAKFSERPYYYRINATDSCEYTSDYSNIGKTIHLTADTSDLFPVLIWTPYEFWVEGVVSYELQVKGWGDFQTVIEIPQSAIPNPQSEISQMDSFFAITGKDYCYRVIAYRTGDSLQSISNEVCILTAFRLFVPNAFTPNNDGINDVFMPAGIYIKEYQMQIYSRWGEKLFESSDIHQGWDGKFKEEYCPAGVYYYQMMVKTAEGKNKTISGSVHLLR